MDEKTQINIISLLYNEYYPLNKLIKNIEIKFIFLLNIKSLQQSPNNDEPNNKTDLNKFFDYIISISNNQPQILESFVEKIIESNEILNFIFSQIDLTDKKVIIGIIVEQYKTMRNIKHFLNKLITKYTYLDDKKISGFKINCYELITLCFLEDVNKNPDALKIFDNNYEFKGKKLFDLTKKYFDKENIPIYVYNFIDERNVLTTSEYYTLSVLKNTDDYYNKFLSFEQLMKQRDIKLEGIYKFGFLYATNEIKLLMIANSKFCKFLLNSYKNELDKIELKNTYNNVLISNIYKNLSPHINSNIIIDELIKLKSVIDKNQVSSSVINSYIDKLCEFINNIKEYLLQFDCKILFYNLPFNEKLYGVLVNTIIGESNLLYYLYENDYINFIQFKDLLTVKNLNDLREKNKIIQKNFDEKLLKEANLSIDCYKDILLNSEYSVNNISNFIKSDKLSFFNLKEIIDLIKKYGYNKKLDSYIFNLLGDDVSIKTFYNYLNSKNFTLSYEMLDFINNNSIFYNWNEDYLQQFKSNNLLEEAIRANYFKNNIIKLEANDYNKTRFKQAIINIFNKMSQQEYNQFAFNKSCQNIIIKNYDWSQLSDSNVWKFVNLINVMSSEDFEKNLNIFNKNLIDLITKKYLKGKKCKF